MAPLLECVPNFSEGRRKEAIGEIVAAARSVPEVHLLDIHSDVDHNRSVLTLVGEPAPLVESVLRAVSAAVRSIDLREHRGQHPRLGAADVVPFIPLGDASMDLAIETAWRVGRRIADELSVPVYFYERAAVKPDRRNLENVRMHGFEELRDAIQWDDSRIPDIGPRAVHPTAGATIVGAREYLIAYNIWLNTSDVGVARSIARTVRHSSGGLRYVKALGLDMRTEGQVQVSMNLTDYRKSSMATVFNLVRSEAASYGVAVARSEVVGLLPVEALVDLARHYLRLQDLDVRDVLEMRLLEEM